MAVKLVIFPPEVQEFGKEIHQHPELIKFLEEAEPEDRRDLAFVLAATGAYLNIPIDRVFTGQELIDLMHDFNIALKLKRQSIILPFNDGPNTIQ